MLSFQARMYDNLQKNSKLKNREITKGEQNDADPGYKKQFWCQECSAIFNSNRQLWHHIKSVHQGVVFSCPFCEYKTDRKDSIERHQKLMHKDMEYLYSCDKCVYTSKYKESLRAHVKNNHKGKPILCDLCKYQAKDVGQMKVHKQIYHGGIRYSCNTCGDLTSNIDSFQKHMQDVH